MKGRERNSEFMPGAIKSAGGPVSKGAMTSTLHNLGEVTSRKTLRVGVVNPLENYVLHDIISIILLSEWIISLTTIREMFEPPHI